MALAFSGSFRRGELLDVTAQKLAMFFPFVEVNHKLLDLAVGYQVEDHFLELNAGDRVALALRAVDTVPARPVARVIGPRPNDLEAADRAAEAAGVERDMQVATSHPGRQLPGCQNRLTV